MDISLFGDWLRILNLLPILVVALYLILYPSHFLYNLVGMFFYLVCVRVYPLLFKHNQENITLFFTLALHLIFSQHAEINLFLFNSYLQFHCLVLSWWFSGKNPPAIPGDLGSIPGLARFPGEGNSNPLQHS